MSFLKNSNTISELKLRVGYGITGQQDIGQNYAYLPRYTASLDNAQYQLGNTFYTTLRAKVTMLISSGNKPLRLTQVLTLLSKKQDFQVVLTITTKTQLIC
jgi:hypothetical protein